MIEYFFVIAIVLSILFMNSVLAVSLAQTTTVSPTSISFPLSKGYVNGKIAFFIATDTSDNQTATSIADNLGHRVNFAPVLVLIPESVRQQGYEFKNGIIGEGPFGFQLPVATAFPGDESYSPIVQLNFVEWHDNATARELKSVKEILSAQTNGELTVTKTNILINSPVVQQ
jgi:hypothetical protein